MVEKNVENHIRDICNGSLMVGRPYTVYPESVQDKALKHIAIGLPSAAQRSIIVLLIPVIALQYKTRTTQSLGDAVGHSLVYFSYSEISSLTPHSFRILLWASSQ